MPITVSSCGRICLVNKRGVYIRELNIAEASLHLEDLQLQIEEDAKARKSETEFSARQRWVEIEAKEKEIEEEGVEAKRKIEHVEQKLKELKNLIEEFRFCKKNSEKRLENLEKAILKQQDLDRAQMNAERVELERLAGKLDGMLQVLKLEKECLDRDCAELTDKECQFQEQNDQRGIIQDQLESDVRKREEKIRQQQETLEWERLDFELMMSKQGDEARKMNAEILERDRVTQETEAREREHLRIVEAQRAQEDTSQSQQALWDKGMEKLRVRAEKLREDEAKVASAAENMAVVKQELRGVEVSLTKVTEEVAAFRTEARIKIDSLIAEHEAKYGVLQIDLKNALEVARNQSQELQDLRAQLAEEDLKRARDCRSDPGRFNEKISEASAEHAESDSKKVNEKRIEGEDSSSTDSIATTKASCKQIDKDEAVGQYTHHTKSPTIDDFVFVGSDSIPQARDHAVTRDSDNEDYLDDLRL
ncbi:hypothetical protein BKA64DRAFT_641507 [Cadophora sp. MPI-SDFR-AT-0126]|nr:hypothetical protein BKA64DRAFT_641507 [Leotiomycetes sp. MPI-SDFR-AT-0126]